MSSNSNKQPDRLLRLAQIIGPEGLIPVSRATWWRGVKDGRFPQPMKLSSRITVWRAAEIADLVNGVEV